MKTFVITGHYGSGKSEIAVNLAIAEKCDVIVDLDIVNPYFRSSDTSSEMQKLGIEVIAPQFAGTNVDIPSLPSKINYIFDQKKDTVFDVGGDEEGAVALGRFSDKFKQIEYVMIMVVNTKRPQTQTEEQIIQMMQEIEASSKMKITHIINNTNLMNETNSQDIIDAQKLLESIAGKTNKKMYKITGFPEILVQLPDELNPLKMEMKRYIHY